MSDLTTPTPPSDDPQGLVEFLRDALEDVLAVQRADPAARNVAEIVLTYPGLHALWAHRVAHRMFRRRYFVPARLLSHVSRHFTGVEIHPGARIGRRVFIDHGMGVVIGETAVIGDDCLIYKGVVLGGTSLRRTKRHPTLGKGVVVGSNACVLGAVDIGDGARVGSGSVIIKDVPSGSTVVGIPGRVVTRTSPNQPASPDLNHAALPDPFQRTIRQLLSEIGRLSDRVVFLEDMLSLEPEELAARLQLDASQDELDQELLDAYNDGEVLG